MTRFAPRFRRGALRRIGQIAVMLLGLAQPAPLWADISTETVRAALAQIHDDPAVREQMLDRLDLPPSLRPAFDHHIQALFSDPVVLDALSSEISQSLAILIKNDETGARTRAIAATYMQGKTLAGIRRLPAAPRRSFYEISLILMQDMPVADCAALMRGTLNAIATQEAEMRVLRVKDPSFVERYLSLIRQAATAELSQGPDYQPLGESERRLAEETFISGTLEAAEKHPKADEIAAAMDNLMRAPDSAVCALGLLTTRVALDIPGEVGDWVLHMIAEE